MKLKNLFRKKENIEIDASTNQYEILKTIVNQGTIEELKSAISKGVNINALDSYSGENILMHYISNNSRGNFKPNEFIKILNSSGFNLNHLRNERLGKSSSFHFAVVNKDLEVIDALIKNGADIEIKDKNGNTPLWRAVMDYNGESQLLEIIKTLLQNGASIDNQNNHNNSPKDIILDNKKAIDTGVMDKSTDLSFLLKN